MLWYSHVFEDWDLTSATTVVETVLSLHPLPLNCVQLLGCASFILAVEHNSGCEHIEGEFR